MAIHHSTDEFTFPPETAVRKSSSTTNLESKVLLKSEGLEVKHSDFKTGLRVEPKKVLHK